MQRRFRLRHSADFDLLRRHGRRQYHVLVVLIVRANGQQMSRFGISASRRVGKATSRNRAKRLLREVLRRRLEAIPGGWDCLFVARKGAAEATFAELDAAVLQLLRRADVLEHAG